MGALLLHPPITLTRVDTLKASFEDAEHLARARRGPAPDYPRLWRGEPATLALPSGYSQNIEARPRSITRDPAPRAGARA